MPQYTVISKGFFDGRLYDPVGKRRTLTVDKPFDKKSMPSWVKPMKAAPKVKATKKKDKDPSFMESDDSKSVETL